MYNFLIIYAGNSFYTNWYDYENNYAEGLIVVNLFNDTITHDGKNWKTIEEDHL